MRTALDQTEFLNTPRFTDEEWGWLITAGNDLVQQMILNGVRISTELNGNAREEVTDWLKINATYFYYIKSTYQLLTVYFANSIDKDAFEKMAKSIKN